MIVIFSGLPGSGKSYKLGQTVLALLYRNRKFYQKTGKRRRVHTNLRLSSAIEAEFEGEFKYWSDLRELLPLRDVDVIFDEVSVYFDSRLWAELSMEMRRWVNQHRKFGIEIYGNAQDFAQVDKAFRRVTSDLLYLVKLAGSRDPSPTMPPPRWVWGIVAVRYLDPVAYDEETSKFASGELPSIMLITREGTEVFDTRGEVKMSASLPMRHIHKVCERPECDVQRLVHV